MRKDSPFFALVAAWWLIAVQLSLTMIVKAQSAAADPNNTAIHGQVTLSGKPARGIKVSLVPGPYGSPATPGRQSVVTDEEGRYEFKELAAGRYGIIAASYVYVSSDVFGSSGFRLCVVAASEKLDNVDLKLVRGGVITGRLTNARSHPVILGSVQISLVDESGKRQAYPTLNNPEMFQTDDRGVYRLFGLLPGRYLVSAGSTGTSGTYPTVYYPGVRDPAQAKLIEVSEGSEATGIDLKLGPIEKTFAASGHVVDAATGQPVSGALVDFSGSVGNSLDERGGFRFNGLKPGQYKVQATPGRPPDYYSEPLTFEITDHDLEGLEVKLQPGAIISGVVALQGVGDLATALRDSSLRIQPVKLDPNARRRDLSAGAVQPDGSFQIRGLPPSQLRLELDDFSHHFYLLQVERDGVALRDALELKPGDQVTALRVVLVAATGALRGRVNVVGVVPDGWTVEVKLQPVGGGVQQERPIELDSSRSFLVQNLAAGDYEIIATLTPKNSAGNPLEGVRQRVTVNQGETAETTLTLNVR